MVNLEDPTLAPRQAPWTEQPCRFRVPGKDSPPGQMLRDVGVLWASLIAASSMVDGPVGCPRRLPWAAPGALVPWGPGLSWLSFEKALRWSLMARGFLVGGRWATLESRESQPWSR